GSVLRSLVFNPRTSPNFSWAWLGRATIVLGYYLVGARLLYFVQDRLGLGVVAAAAAVGSLALIGGVAKIVALLASGPLSDRWGRRPFVAGAAVVVALGLLSLTVATDLTTLTICYFVLALGFGVFVGVDQALVADVLPARSDVAKDLGIINLAATLPQTLAPAIGSLLLAASGGSYNALLIVGAVIAATTAVATYRIKGVR
ncbi:MAG: MFS transporter, partial [Actinomycetes bacterium]